MSQTLRLYPLSNFTFSTKEAQPEEDPSVAARLQRLQNNYEDFGMRRTVEGVLVVHVSSRGLSCSGRLGRNPRCRRRVIFLSWRSQDASQDLIFDCLLYRTTGIRIF